MDDEKLIQLVQERSEIYNKLNPFYKYVDKKQEAWMDIANEMGTTVEDCMRRWSSLRDRFTRECKKMKNSNDTDAMVIWPYFEMMEFIRPFITPRLVRGWRFSATKMPSTIQKHSPLPTLIKKHSPPPSLIEKHSPAPSTTHSSPASPAASPMECGEFTQIYDDPLIEKPLPKKKTSFASPEVDKSFCEAVEALKKACALNEARHANPAVHAFGEMIVSTICSMNSRNQLKVMQQVTDTVMRIKLEEDELLEQVAYSTL